MDWWKPFTGASVPFIEGLANRVSWNEEAAMPLQRLMLILLALLPMSVVGMAIGGSSHRFWLVVASATGFCGSLILVALASNAPYWRGSGSPAEDAALAVTQLCRNSRLLAIAYAWGALAMQILYTTRVTGLKWQHGWQYAATMALISSAAMLFARLLETDRPGQRHALLAVAAPLAIGQALFAAGGLVFLATSGKLMLRGTDWAANQVFLFGSLSVMILAAVTLRTHARLTRG